jgi:hypothetical protein
LDWNGVDEGYNTPLRQAVLDAAWGLYIPGPESSAAVGVVGVMLEYAATWCTLAHLEDVIQEVQAPCFQPVVDSSSQLIRMLTECAARMRFGC